MKSHLSNPWNFAVAFLEMFYGEQPIATGSCFFWGFDGRTFLVTNWHNLAGRDPLTGQPMSETGAIPDRVIFRAYKRENEPDSQGFFELAYLPLKVKLCESDLTNPQWYEHPTLGRRIDVAAIDVTEAIQGFQINCANELENDAVLDVIASQDVFVVGIPFGLISNAPAPIWKRGSIALDPTFDPEGLPKMLIDTATREGMSGSVVVARHVIVGRDYPKKDGTKSQPVLYAKFDLVAGIYSGRHYPDLRKRSWGLCGNVTPLSRLSRGDGLLTSEPAAAQLPARARGVPRRYVEQRVSPLPALGRSRAGAGLSQAGPEKRTTSHARTDDSGGKPPTRKVINGKRSSEPFAHGIWVSSSSRGGLARAAD